jgi:hypothetical protein
MKMLSLRRMPMIGIISLAALHITAHAADLSSKAFDAALCKPAYSVESSTALYQEAEKVSKADVLAGMATYKLPKAVERDGLTAEQLVFAGTSVGVVIEGTRAQALAAKYQLVNEDEKLLSVNNPNAAHGYARQIMVNGKSKSSIYGTPGTILITAREGEAFQGKALLTCEFISDYDRAQAKVASR